MSGDADYELAKADPIAALVLAALHEQDARTYNGNASDIGSLAVLTAARIRVLLADSPEARA